MSHEDAWRTRNEQIHGPGWFAYRKGIMDRGGYVKENDWCERCPSIPHWGVYYVMDDGTVIYLCPLCRGDYV